MSRLPSLPARDMWQSLREEPRPIVIYGMGNGADKLIARLDFLGIKYADIFASDGFVRGHSFHGVRVKSFSEIKELYSDFVILLSFATRREDVISMLESIDEDYDMYVPDMPVSEESVYFDAAFYEEHYEEIERARSAFDDEESKNTFDCIIRYKLSGRMTDILALTHTKEDMYRLLSRRAVRSCCDVGAYNGDTLMEALEYFPELKRAVCIEPDARTFKRLLRYAEGIEGVDVKCINAAAFDGEGTAKLSAAQNRNTSVIDASTSSFRHRTETVPLVTVDSLGEDFDYIKYDVEGSEREALSGSHKTICKSRPALLVSLYHKSRDIFELVNMLREKYPNYRFYLRRLCCLPAWEINLIMLPA